MRHVRLTLDAGGREGEIHSMYDVLANAPFVDRAKTTHWNVTGDEIGIMHYVEGDADPFADAVDDIPTVEEFELTPVDDGAFYAYFRSVLTDPAAELFGTLARGRLVVVPPMEWDSDGTVWLSLVGSSAEIRAAIEGVPDPVEAEVREVTGLARATDAVESLLSDRQREAVERALELGYYDVPREAGHEAVADALDCAPSTAAEHLRKAESKLIRSVLD